MIDKTKKVPVIMIARYLSLEGFSNPKTIEIIVTATGVNG